MKVFVTEVATGKSLQLDKLQVELFAAEFAHVKRRPPLRGAPPRLAPHMILTVERGSQRKDYQILSSTYLFDEKTKKGWLFYFALLLAIWLR